jgi:hypothetical protein
MAIKREDLMAAATAGVLHYGEIDPLLIFLAQREANVKKMTQQHIPPSRNKRSLWLYYLGGILAISIATLLGAIFLTQDVISLGLVALLWFSLLYALCAIGVAAWTDIRKGSVPLGLFIVLIIALMPLAVFALQRVVE